MESSAWVWPPVPNDLNVTPPSLEDSESHACIAYCKDDVTFTQILAETIDKCGFSCRHADIDGETGDYIDIISRSVEHSRVVVAVITPNMRNATENWMPAWIARSKAKMAERKEKMGEQEKVIFIPILHEVKPNQVSIYLREMDFIETLDRQFWPKLLSKISDPETIKNVLPVGNLAHGLSWSYYYGYLVLVLPGLAQRVLHSEFGKKGLPILPKMVVVIPESGVCPAKFLDENIKHEGHVMCKASRAGKNFRDYRSNVYRVTDPRNGQEYLTILEYASVISILAEMENYFTSTMDSTKRRQQLLLFKDKIEEIVNHRNNEPCNNGAVFVFYNDTSCGDDPDGLSRLLANTISADKDLVKP